MNEEAKGRRAREILNDEVFKEAERLAKEYIKTAWEHEASAARRESLWHQLQGGSPLARALRAIAGEGTMAEHERTKQEKREVYA